MIRENYPRWIPCSALIGVLIGNVIEAGVDIGGRCEKETLSNIANEMSWVAVRGGCCKERLRASTRASVMAEVEKLRGAQWRSRFVHVFQ